jgi:hypothetical protein
MTMIPVDLSEPLENEWYGVRHSGEIPEIALHSAIYYLTEDGNGPGMVLDPRQSRVLVEAADIRYREIILRDLLQKNRNTAIYRGVKRSIVNWQRYEVFCRRHAVENSRFRHEVAAALLVFLVQEIVEVERGRRLSSINCTFSELSGFACRLGLVNLSLPEYVRPLCRA